MESYIYTEFSKKLLSCYFIDLCQILNMSKLEPVKFINLNNLLIYWRLIIKVILYTLSKTCRWQTRIIIKGEGA